MPPRPVALLASACAALVIAPAVPASAAPIVARVLVGLDRDVEGLKAFATAVSDPASASYRAYRPVGDLARQFGASDATVASARAQLRRQGFTRSTLDVTRGFLIVPATAAQLDALGPDSVEATPRAGAGMIALRSGAAGRIVEVVAKAAALTPMAAGHHGTGQARWPVRTGTPRGCAKGVDIPLPFDGSTPPGSKAFTPNQFQVAFGMASLHRQGVQGQGQHVALFQSGAGVKRADVTRFARCFGVPMPDMRIVPVGQARPLDPATAGNTLEASLDVQAVLLSAPRARITVVEGGARATWPEVMSAALDARRMRGLPDVLSVSYGQCEPVVHRSLFAYLNGAGARRLADWVMMTAAGAGVSVVAAAGDSGAAGCAHAMGATGGIPAGAHAPQTIAAATTNWVSYPASSPWATAVGGTSMTLRRDNTIRTQRVWNDQQTIGLPAFSEFDADDGTPMLSIDGSGGGGGTSLLYRTPPWQSASGIVSPRRTVPDVSMYAAPGVAMVCSAYDTGTGDGPCPPGRESWPFTSVAGTSFAAPLLAGAVALANQRAEAVGQARAGFLSPLLYSSGRFAIRDVTTGNNDVFGTGRCCFAGPGYDQATGLGTVNATRLAQAVVRAGG